MHFIKYFIATSVILLLSYCALIEIVNPQGTALFSSNYYSKYHVNLEYAKFKALEKNNSYENLVIGSSTSEAFLPVDVTKNVGGLSYSVSLGGATTSARLAMIKRAIDTNKNIKRIFYIADFFEFNKTQTKPSLFYNKEMSSYFNKKNTDATDYLKHYFNHQLLEDAFRVVKRSKKNKKIIVNTDGTTNRSMILSPLKGQDLDKMISKKNYAQLEKQFLENYQTYSNEVLKDFSVLSPLTTNLYEEMSNLISKSNIKLVIVAGPYHQTFKQLLMNKESIKTNYQKWRDYLNQYSKSKKDHYFIDGTILRFANSSKTAVWRDGIHFNRYAAFEILQKAALDISNLKSLE